VAESVGGLAEALEDRDVRESRCGCRAGRYTRVVQGSLFVATGRLGNVARHVSGTFVRRTVWPDIRIDEFLEDGINIVDPTAVVTQAAIGRELLGLVTAEAHESLPIAGDI